MNATNINVSVTLSRRYCLGWDGIKGRCQTLKLYAVNRYHGDSTEAKGCAVK